VGRIIAALRWLASTARRLLRQSGFPGVPKSSAWAEWYKDLYRDLGERALQSGQPGQQVPELILHDMEGNYQQLSRCWRGHPALLVTMSLTCGQTRQQIRGLRQLSQRFENDINTVIIYVVEPHPVNERSPYADGIWVTTKNEMAGIRCNQPRTVQERVELAHRMRQRFRLSSFTLIDTLDNRAWQAFGGAPNVAILVGCDGKIALKQGWFEATEMEHAITGLLKASLDANPGYRMSSHG
jgi:hypothetical protein